MIRLPVLRSDCIPGGAGYARPCPFKRCRYHLEAKDGATGGRPSTVVRDPSQTCALDVADGGAATLEHVGSLLGVTRERVRQIEVKALRKARYRAQLVGLDLGDIIEAPRHPLSSLQSTTDDRGRPRQRLRDYQARYVAKKKATKAKSA